MVITSDDKETNLCEVCGQRFLSLAFEAQKKALQNQDRVRKQQIRLHTILQQSEEIKGRIKELKQVPYGANWLYRSLTNFQKTYPVELLTALSELATNKDDNATLNALVENNGDPSRLEQIEQLEGLGIFTADIREVLIDNLLKPVKQLEEYAANPDSSSSLAALCQWADRLDDQFTCAEYLLTEGRAFFKTKNLERPKSLPLSKSSTRLTRSLRWDCDKAEAKVK